jgi:hypothetical protein
MVDINPEIEAETKKRKAIEDGRVKARLAAEAEAATRKEKREKLAKDT